jgi:hypothetical protein
MLLGHAGSAVLVSTPGFLKFESTSPVLAFRTKAVEARVLQFGRYFC